MLDRLLGGGEGRGLLAHLFLIRLGLAFAFLLLGTFPILAGLGLLRLESPIEPLAIPVALLFGGVFVALGVAIVWGPLRELASAHGAESGEEVRALALRRFLGRAHRASAVGAADLALLSLACALAWGGVRLPLVGDPGTLSEVVALEFLTIHAFPFLVTAATFWAASRGGARVAVAAFTAILLAGYGIGAWVVGGGPTGIFWLVWLWIPNLAPFLAGGPGPRRGARARGEARLLAVSRWCVKVTLFMATAGVVGGGDFAGPEVVRLGALYFGLMAVVELLRVAEIPGDLAAEWKRLESGGAATAPGA